MTEHEFTLGFIERLNLSIPDSEFKIVSDLRIHTKDIGGYELNIFLGNAYDVYKSESRELELIYDDQLAAIKNQHAVFSNNDVKSILPVLKSRGYIETAKKQLKEAGYDKEELPFYYEKLNEDIYKMFVYDSQDSMRFVSPDDLKKHGIGGSISSIASTNMKKYYKNIGAQINEVDTNGNGRLWLFSADENYEASILTVLGYLELSMQDHGSDFVVFVPARNISLIVKANDSVAIQLASNLAAQGYNEFGYPISPYGYVNKDGKWQRIQP
ncbi:hypothetical protein [Glaciecola sp. 1036]|uniref:hypothetical protein n=1 Tax=Alteromonadaceae TaxID=72275 RepID=UPI003D003D9E